MALDLSSVEAKIGRAKTHLESYRRELMLWGDKKPYSLTKERNEDFTRFYAVLHIGENPNFEDWTLIIADAIHNLRCALDHLIFAIAVHESGKNPPPKERDLAFPIVDQPADFKEASWRIATLSQPVRAAIEAMQPYNRTHPSVAPPLAILRKFENSDKHRLLSLAFASQYEGEVSLNIPSGQFGKGTFLANHGKLEDNTVLMSWVFDKPEPGVNFEKIDIGIAIALWHEKRDPSGPFWSDRSEVSALLTLISTEVRFVVDTIAAVVKM